jgi:hypothetical protein
MKQTFMVMNAAWLGGHSCRSKADRFYLNMVGIYNLAYALQKKYYLNINVNVKVKWSRYRPGVAQRVGRGIALLFHDRGTGRGWVVRSTPWPHFTTGKDPVPIL